jgi:hypothetical protein
MLPCFKGLPMWWFTKRKHQRQEIWDEDIQWPIGDLEAAHRIREICRSAANSPESVGGSGRRDHANEPERYERATRAAMEIAVKISDDLLRDASVRQIVDLCVTADNLKTARILFRAIQTVSIREEVLSDHPVLRR